MISHHHQCIFVHIPKCGGQSIERAVLRDLGLSWAQRDQLLMQPNADPTQGPPRLAHLKAEEYLRYGYTPQWMFDSYFKFTVVRNPWRRAVSLYHHHGYSVSFKRFACDILPHRLWHTTFWFVAPQTAYIYNASDLCLVDKIYELETIASAYAELQQRLGLTTYPTHDNATKSRQQAMGIKGRLAAALKKLASADPDLLKSLFMRKEMHPDWRAYYDRESRAAIAQLYAGDVARFQYAFE